MRNATLDWVVADDGSDIALLEEFTYMMSRLRGENWENVRTPRLGCGGALNAGLHRAFDLLDTDVVFYAQDDWELIEYLDLVPALELMEKYDAYHVRVGLAHPDVAGRVRRWWRDHGDEYWFLDYDVAAGGYAYAWRPALHHRELYERVGWVQENVSCVEAERDYNARCATALANEPFRFLHAPNVTLSGPFRHIETVELGEDDPATLTARYGG